MKVSKLIEALSSQYNPDDSIVIAWWTQESFSEAHGLEPDEWKAAAEFMDDMDWNRTHDALTDTLDYWIARSMK